MAFLFIIALSILSTQAGATSPAPEVLQSFTYAEVQVTGGPMAAQAKDARHFFLSLNEDSLLKGLRARAGLPAPGPDMGGWYDPQDFAGAHSFGQYLSALARMYANTHDLRFKEKVDRLVHGFHLTMAPDGYFYASDKVAKEWPGYVYDKNAMGMRNAYSLTGNREALEVLSKMTDWVDAHLSRRSDEWYTLTEGFYLSYELTNEARYLRLAAEYDASQDFYDLFAVGKNAFTPDLQAYSHVNSLLSAAKIYEFTGNAKYLTVIENAWRFLTETQMYASGGWGPGERFVQAGQGKLSESVTNPSAAFRNGQPANFETPCGTYANMNLNRYLMRFTGQSKYGDNMDRVLTNGILAALPIQKDGSTFYYSNYQPGAKKEYFLEPWPCCSGSYAQITADYPLNIFFHDKNGIYVNLFAGSSIKWKAAFGLLSIEQKTDYPLSDKTQITIHLAKPQTFSVHVRIPKWLKKMLSSK